MDMKPKFCLGQLAATPGALEALADSGQTPEFFLHRHVTGDWGEVSDDDKQLNDHGSRILSAYKTLKGARVWIITEAGDSLRRSLTTILLPEEY